ncbi:MAG: alkaline phosphatase family protein [Thermoanaerobaculia bacterium]
MKSRVFILILIVLVIAGLAVVHFRYQPEGMARLIRSGDDLRVVTARIGWAPLYLGTSSLVQLRNGEKLAYAESFPVEGGTGAEYTADVSFGYDAPRTIPPSWGSGSFSDVLSRHVRQLVARWAAAQPLTTVTSDSRAAGRRAEEAIAPQLSGDGIQTQGLTIRLQVPDALAAVKNIPEVTAAAKTSRKVIFVGLDGADWELLDEYMADGSMPNLKQLVAEGSGGILGTEHPPLSPIVWTTMMTGRSPLDHEVLDFTRFNPATHVKEPITSDERHVPAVWNMGSWGSRKVAVFGLWATYPAEPVNGLIVSDRLFTFLYKESAPPPGVVFPPSREKWARAELERVESSTDFGKVRTYLPWLTKEEYDEQVASPDPYSHPISALQRILVETEVYNRLGKEYIGEHHPDVAVVYFQGTDSIGHIFAPFVPPKQPEVSQEDYDRYKEVPKKYFHRIDAILGEYRELAKKEGAVLMIASDHGFRWREGRPTELSSFAAATAAKWHREEGIYLLWGEGIPAHPGHPGRGGVRQVCATLLALNALPEGAHVKEPPLGGAEDPATTVVDYTKYYQPYRPSTGAAPAGDADEALAKLKALGYIGSAESVTAAPGSLDPGSTRTAGWYNNQALILRSEGNRGGAVTAWEKAIRIDPDLASALWNLSDTLYQDRREADRSDELLLRALKDGLPEGKKFVIGRAIGYQRNGEEDRALKLMSGAVGAVPQDAELRMFRGRYRVDRKDCSGALEDFKQAQSLAPGNPVAYSSAAVAALCMGDQAEAVRNFRQSLQLDPNQPRVRAFLQRMGE